MGKVRWVMAVLVALYAVYYWVVIRNQCVYKGDVGLNGKTAIVTGKRASVSDESEYLFLPPC